MHKVLLVDDERIILEGISAVVEWKAAGTELVGTARNGLEALDAIEEHKPDIIISDIRMPAMDGLQLAAKVHELHPHIKLIMLSGFNEFEYARTAMQYGVKHYLLKPCNESKIVEALKDVAEELRQSVEREEFVSQMREGLAKVLPHVKEQFLKEFVTNKTYGAHDWAYYRKLFDLDLATSRVRLILFQLEGSFEFEHLFAVKNIAGDILPKTLLSSTIGDHVIIAVEDDAPLQELHEMMHRIRETFRGYYKIDLTIALSEAGDITTARALYKETLECLQHRFYLGEGSLITKRDLTGPDHKPAEEFIFDEEQLLLMVKAGRWDDASGQIDDFFAKAVEQRAGVYTVKSYVIQLFMAIIRLADAERINAYMGKLVQLAEIDTLLTMQSFLKEAAHEITMRQYEQNKSKHSAIVQKVIGIIEEQLGNPELSLNWVAHQLLYMNADYLGKLFKKETDEKFSNFVMKARIKKATELLDQRSDMKIFELAEQLGFGDNPQYFSQVFKKIVGCTPSEYTKA
ncbi:two-component system, response regulator YesN [Paenibacillus sp. UNCCL117]|uniref:response regulator n=1 Tax=unclassified Paenibacillus TaxID=185978 RepID=UPI0008826CBF|nr:MULTISPECIES: response regulator [unclassified Paenibacillus]SDD37231.1 two-component system, response regulator YesN [Paenibacillus sp. cl123]SFW48823.1 two-component system, response regulator YesN [Paenibacillus sp. UNCCL117]